MEKLPQHLENKIFYYLSHPIAESLKDKQIVLLKSKDSQLFDYDNTTIVFSPKKLGIEKGLYTDLNHTYFIKSLSSVRPCYASPTYLMHYKLRKYLKDKIYEEENKYEIDILMYLFMINGVSDYSKDWFSEVSAVRLETIFISNFAHIILITNFHMRFMKIFRHSLNFEIE